MPNFKVKNLSVSIGEAEQAIQPGITPQLCIFPSHCNFHTPITCNFHTPITCHFRTPITCWTPTIDTCAFNTCGIFSDPCGFITPRGCGVAHSTLPETTFDGLSPVIRTVSDPGVLEALQTQLDEAMVAIKEHGVELEQGLLPRTLEDAEMLESEMEAALKEVRKLKKSLK